MRTITVTTRLDAPADVVLRGARTPAVFRAITRGLVDLPALRGRETPFEEGEEVASPMRVLGLPFSTHHLRVARLDEERGVLLTEEHGGLLRSWVHTISVTPTGPGTCRYTDRVDIDAVLLTPVVALAAHAFYVLRQRRWRTLAPVLASAGTGA